MTSPRGAYGLRLGPPLLDEHLVAAPPGWPEWHLRWQETPASGRRTQRLGVDEALINLKPEGQVRADFGSRTSTFLLPAEPSPEAWAHPHLSVTAVLAARWLGRRSFHSGAFVAGDGAWGVLGDRGQGKTSTLAWLASHGYPVVCDDILVLDGGTAFAGPRCLDLRETAARHFHMGSYIGRVGTRVRWRARLGPVPAEVPLRGWVVPSWADEVSTVPVAPAARLERLLAKRALIVHEPDDANWLPLLALPMVELRRPQRWSVIDDAMACLLGTISGL